MTKPTPQEWFYQVEGKTIGPLTATELRQHAQNGRLDEFALVAWDDCDRWVPPSNFKGLLDTPSDATGTIGVTPRTTTVSQNKSSNTAEIPKSSDSTTPLTCRYCGEARTDLTEHWYLCMDREGYFCPTCFTDLARVKNGEPAKKVSNPAATETNLGSRTTARCLIAIVLMLGALISWEIYADWKWKEEIEKEVKSHQLGGELMEVFYQEELRYYMKHILDVPKPQRKERLSESEYRRELQAAGNPHSFFK